MHCQSLNLRNRIHFYRKIIIFHAFIMLSVWKREEKANHMCYLSIISYMQYEMPIKTHCGSQTAWETIHWEIFSFMAFVCINYNAWHVNSYSISFTIAWWQGIGLISFMVQSWEMHDSEAFKSKWSVLFADIVYFPGTQLFSTSWFRWTTHEFLSKPITHKSHQCFLYCY